MLVSIGPAIQILASDNLHDCQLIFQLNVQANPFFTVRLALQYESKIGGAGRVFVLN